VPTYLVERYEPGSAAGRLGFTELPAGGRPGATEPPIRLVLSTLIPADEISLSLFEAPSESALANALAAGGLPFIRIVEAVVPRWGSGCPGADDPR
jgi:hypothetical protein